MKNNSSEPKATFSFDDLEIPKCPQCGELMKKVSWKITAGAFDAGKEVEQSVFQCPFDKNFVSLEVSTGKPSEFALDQEY